MKVFFMNQIEQNEDTLRMGSGKPFICSGQGLADRSGGMLADLST
jgi:hypothetical protein